MWSWYFTTSYITIKDIKNRNIFQLKFDEFNEWLKESLFPKKGLINPKESESNRNINPKLEEWLL